MLLAIGDHYDAMNSSKREGLRASDEKTRIGEGCGRPQIALGENRAWP
jgi:hypothetical protein